MNNSEFKNKLKMPTNDEECRALRDVCGRTEEQIDAIFQFAKLAKELEMGDKLSIKRINRLIGIEKPKAIARYLRGFLPPEKRKLAEVRLDEYAHKLVKQEKYVEKPKVLKKIKELSE